MVHARIAGDPALIFVTLHYGLRYGSAPATGNFQRLRGPPPLVSPFKVVHGPFFHDGSRAPDHDRHCVCGVSWHLCWMHFPHVEEYVEGSTAANVDWEKQVVEILWSNYGPVIVSDCSETVPESHPCRVFSVSYEQPRRCPGRGHD